MTQTEDKIITCPKSKGDLCYETQITPEITNWFSLSCGFWTNSLMKKDSDFYNEQLNILPELYKELAWEDPETGLIWLPTTINDPKHGMVFANGPSSQQWAWAAVKSVPVTAEEKEKYPQEWKSKTSLQKLCMMRALRPDRMLYALSLFVEEKLGRKYVENRTIECEFF